jgi:fatty-acyl-CoA synthase
MRSLLSDPSETKGVTIVGDGKGNGSSWRDLVESGQVVAANLADSSIGPGDRIVVISSTCLDLLRLIVGAWFIGATISIASPPRRRQSEEKLVEWVRFIDQQLAPSLIVVGLGRRVWDAFQTKVESLSDLVSGSPSGSGSHRRSAEHESDAILQLTSGSTAVSKVTRIPPSCIQANVVAMSRGLSLDPDYDTMVSWLPLQHDMGLIGFFVMPMLIGIDLVLIDTQTFVNSPSLWFEECSRGAATIICAPNSAYVAAQRTLRPAVHRLGSVRLAINGAESIDPVSFGAFLDDAATCGMKRTSAFCVYGMAEATLAVTFPEVGAGMQTDTVRRSGLLQRKVAEPPKTGDNDLIEFVKVGRPLAGVEVRIASRDANAGERVVGSIEIRGPSVSPGYLWGETRSEDQWFETGDLGYQAEGSLIVCGRSKGVVVVGGINYFAEVVERSAGRALGARLGDVIAFNAPFTGGEKLVIALESKLEFHDVKKSVAKEVLSGCGLRADEILVLSPGTLAKTSSGKIARSQCISLYEKGEFE